MRIIICLFLLITALGIPAFSQEKEAFAGQINKDNLPVPNEPNQLFYLQRDPDYNTIIYTLNIENGQLNLSEPVLNYWIRYAENGQTQKLSFIQRRMAYGIHVKELDAGVFELRVQAYKSLKIILSKNAKTEKYQASVKVKDKDILLSRIFVRIDGGSLFKPNVEYIEIFGKNKATGKDVTYRVDI